MLDLTDKQAEIIKIFIEQYRDESNKVSKGITSRGLEKQGIERKTFRNHQDYFLKNYFLRLTKVEYHGFENYSYFQITRLGVLAYLKWQSSKPESDIWLDREFFPMMFNHWETLVDDFQQVLFDVLKKTLNRIEIRPELEGTIHGEKVYGGKLEESIIIPMGLIEIKLFRKYKEIDVHLVPKKRDYKTEDVFELSNQEIDEKITERFTFLLFFNLLHLGSSAGELVNLYMQNYIQYDQNNSSSLTEEEIKSTYSDYVTKTQEKVSNLFVIVNQDPMLHNLLKSTIEEITEMLADRKTVQAIYDKLE